MMTPEEIGNISRHLDELKARAVRMSRILYIAQAATLALLLVVLLWGIR